MPVKSRIRKTSLNQTNQLSDFSGFLNTLNEDAAAALITKALSRAGIDRSLAARIGRERGFTLAESMKAWRELQAKRMLARSIREGWSEDEFAERLATVVGLTQRQENSVERYRQSLLAQGEPRGIARQKSKELAQRHRRTRAQTLARTETQHALNEAVRETWRANPELMGVNRIWVLGKNENNCVICKGLAGKKTHMHGLFKGTGDAHPGPPAHPNCMCYEILDL